MKKWAILLLLTVLISSCSSVDASLNKKPTKTVHRIGLEMREKHALFDRGFTFQLKEKEAFVPEIKLVNEVPEESTYELLFLLDYKQIAVKHNGDFKKAVRVETAAQSTETVPVEIPDLPPGRHDLLVISARNPQNHLTSNEFVNGMKSNLYRRVTVIVGEDKAPSPTFEQVAAEALEDKKNGNVFLTQEPGVQNGDALKLFEYDGNPNVYMNFRGRPTVERYAVTMLVNGVQGEQPIRFIEKTGDLEGIVTIPATMQGIETDKPNEVLAIVAENPFGRPEDEQGKFTKLPLAVLFSNKITVQ